MLPIVLVLLFVTSALAAPSVSVTQYGINEIAPPRNNGNLVSSYVTTRAFEVVDGGDTNIYILTLQQIINDLANMPDKNSHALAMGQTIAVLTQLATGNPGDACIAANVIDAYADSVRTGNTDILRNAVAKFIENIAGGLNLIVALSNNPNSVRYAVGSRGNCAGGGKNYAFELGWDEILGSATPSQAGLLNEEYCAAKRLYNAFNTQSNNIGAFLTAASLPPVVQIIQSALEPVARFLGAIPAGSASQFSGAARQALLGCL